jgi:hypothetical protein
LVLQPSRLSARTKAHWVAFGCQTHCEPVRSAPAGWSLAKTKDKR